MSNTSKMSRLLHIYDEIKDVITINYLGDFDETEDIQVSPIQLTRSLGMSRRTLYRDLKELCDCGLISVKYYRSINSFVNTGEAAFDEQSSARRKQHLRRLYRLGMLVKCLPRINSRIIDDYLSELYTYRDYVQFAKEDPWLYTPEMIENKKKELIANKPSFPDLKKRYYKLFPDSNERTRQRDFKELNDAGFTLYYDKVLKTHIFTVEDAY